MFRRIVAQACFLLVIFNFAGMVFGQAPKQMNYQAVLTDPSTGDPVADGSYTVVFSIYNTQFGGSAIWSEIRTVQTQDGLFSVLLGSISPLTPAVLNGPQKFLGIKVGADPEMTPRKRLVSSPYAIISGEADKLDGQDAGDFAAAAHNHDARYFTESELRISDGNPPNQGSNRVSWKNLTDVPSGFADEVDNVSTGGSGISQITVGAGMNVSNPSGPTTTLSLKMGHNNNIDADKVDGKHASSFASTSHSHSGSDITSGKISNTRLNTGATNGLDADKVDGKHASDLGADNLGNHSATLNIKLNGNWLSGDGGYEGVFVKSDGNVGIGASNPNHKLDVIGDLRATSGVKGYGGTYGVYGAKSQTFGSNYGYLGGGSYGTYGKHSSGNYGYLGGGSYGIYGKHSSGNWGYIGGGHGIYGHHSGSGNWGYIGGSIYGIYGRHSSGSYGYLGGGSYAGYFSGSENNGTSSATVKISSPGQTMLIDGNEIDALKTGLYLNNNIDTKVVIAFGGGYVGIGDGSPAYRLELPNIASTMGRARANAWKIYSSRRWKTNITSITGALDKVQKLRGVYFDWKAGSVHDIGLIAEEVGEVIPEVVSYEENGKDASSLDYARLVSLLIEAIKELKAENESLKQRIKALEQM